MKTKDKVARSNEKHALLQPTGHSQNASAKKHLLLGGKTFFTLFSSQCCTDCHGVIPQLYNINERRVRTLFPKLVSHKYQRVFHNHQPMPGVYSCSLYLSSSIVMKLKKKKINPAPHICLRCIEASTWQSLSQSCGLHTSLPLSEMKNSGELSLD